MRSPQQSHVAISLDCHITILMHRMTFNAHKDIDKAGALKVQTYCRKGTMHSPVSREQSMRAAAQLSTVLAHSLNVRDSIRRAVRPYQIHLQSTMSRVQCDRVCRPHWCLHHRTSTPVLQQCRLNDSIVNNGGSHELMKTVHHWPIRSACTSLWKWKTGSSTEGAYLRRHPRHNVSAAHEARQAHDCNLEVAKEAVEQQDHSIDPC